MPLLFNLHHLETKNLRLAGELAAQELELEQVDELIHADRPLNYDLEVQKLADSILVQGQLQLALECECVRCLKPFQYKLVLNRWACHLPLHGEEKVPIANDCVDLTPYVREDILLEFPQHPLCKPECGGLPKKTTGQIKNPGGSEAKDVSSAWAALNRLKL
jgi:uncharacterized protein